MEIGIYVILSIPCFINNSHRVVTPAIYNIDRQTIDQLHGQYLKLRITGVKEYFDRQNLKSMYPFIEVVVTEL